MRLTRCLLRCRGWMKTQVIISHLLKLKLIPLQYIPLNLMLLMTEIDNACVILRHYFSHQVIQLRHITSSAIPHNRVISDNNHPTLLDNRGRVNILNHSPFHSCHHDREVWAVQVHPTLNPRNFFQYPQHKSCRPYPSLT